MTNAMLYYTVDVLWYLYDVTYPRMFPPYPGLGVWQIGIRAIGYSELVNFLNEKKSKIYDYSH